MRIIVLGGAGLVGREVVKDLARIRAVTSIGVADWNLQGAVEQAAAVGARAVARQADVTDAAGLVEAVKGYDVVVNTVGPFYRNGARVLEACLAARVHYVDICDDYDAAELLLGYDDRCKRRGITAVIAGGASPGVTNMLGVLGANQMDRVNEIHTAWVENIADAGGFVVWWHGMHMASGAVPQYLDGQWVRVPALSGATELDFGPPLGRWPVYYVGHPEPVTLPRFVKGVRTVTNRGNCWPAAADIGILLKPYADLGLLSTDCLEVNGTQIIKRDFIVHHLISGFQDAGGAATPDEPHFAIRVDVTGTAGDAAMQYTYRIHVRDTSELTGTSASFCAQRVASGALSLPGVRAPEGCVEPTDYLRYLADRGVTVTETRTTTKPLSV